MWGVICIPSRDARLFNLIVLLVDQLSSELRQRHETQLTSTCSVAAGQVPPLTGTPFTDWMLDSCTGLHRLWPSTSPLFQRQRQSDCCTSPTFIQRHSSPLSGTPSGRCGRFLSLPLLQFGCFCWKAALFLWFSQNKIKINYSLKREFASSVLGVVDNTTTERFARMKDEIEGYGPSETTTVGF